MPRVPDVTDLPVELLDHIFAFLPDQSLTGTSHDIGWLVATHVCRSWRAITLSRSRRNVRIHLRPDRAQRYIQARIHELFLPLSIALVVHYYRFDSTRAREQRYQWKNTMELLSLVSARIHTLNIFLGDQAMPLHDEKIEKLFALVLREPSLVVMTVTSSHYLGSMTAGCEVRIPPVPAELQGGGLRVLKLEGCRLPEQTEFFSTQPLLEELSTTVQGPLRLFLSDLRTTSLTMLHLTWMPPNDSLQRNDPKNPKGMPALLELSLQSTVKGTLTFMHTVHLPALVSLKIVFVPQVVFGEDTGAKPATAPLVDWLSSRFGDIPGCAEIGISATSHLLCVNMSWSARDDRPTYRKLEIRFPRLPSRNEAPSTHRVEDCETFLHKLSEKFAPGETMRVSVTVDPYMLLDRRRTTYPAPLKGTVMKYMNKLHRATSLQLGPYAALMVLPLGGGSFSLLSELRIRTWDPEGTAYLLEGEEAAALQSRRMRAFRPEGTDYRLYEDQLASLRALARGEAESRRGRCRVEVDGIDLTIPSAPNLAAGTAEGSGVDRVD
ncbi:unnamed protein product [Peniophora sp. CBMAI 1063]|nr:unnamed protein product [Peniophora sp. CBMAI 1063]